MMRNVLRLIFFNALCLALVNCETETQHQDNEIETSTIIQQMSVPPANNNSSILNGLADNRILRWVADTSESFSDTSRLRSMFRSAYFTYQHYRPEMQFGMCIMRFAGATQFKIIDNSDESNGIAQNATQYMRSLYNQISSSVGKAMDIIACDGTSSNGIKCGRRKEKINVAGDGSMDVYRVILMNMAEKWLRSIKLLRPLMVSISSMDLKMVGRYFSSVLDRNMELLSDLFMPGLYGCVQKYLNKLMWRTLESWI